MTTKTKKTKSSTTPEQKLAKEASNLTKEVTKLSKEINHLKHLEFIKVLKSPWRMMWFAFWKGMFVGFGTVVGASFLVGVFVFLVSQIQFVPVIGDFVKEIIQEIDTGNVLQIDGDMPEEATEPAEEPQADTEKNDPLALEDRPSCDIPIDYLPSELGPDGHPLL